MECLSFLPQVALPESEYKLSCWDWQDGSAVILCIWVIEKTYLVIPAGSGELYSKFFQGARLSMLVVAAFVVRKAVADYLRGCTLHKECAGRCYEKELLERHAREETFVSMDRRLEPPETQRRSYKSRNSRLYIRFPRNVTNALHCQVAIAWEYSRSLVSETTQRSPR